METKKTILVCPLNWGLGHASRCVPLIENLTQRGFQVIIASSGRAQAFLKQYFPELKQLDFPDYRIQIPRSGRLIGYLLLRMPLYLYRIHKEHKQLKSIIRSYQVDVVISDNRYGLWSREARSIFITHQLMLKCPSWLRFTEGWVHRMILRYVKKFDACWIPDGTGDSNLSGDLSHQYPLPGNALFVGHMSRFEKMTEWPDAAHYDMLALISGPEPQRSVFEERILQRFRETGRKCCIVRGMPGQAGTEKDGNIDLIPHTGDAHLAALIQNAELVICRPGYSTLMDLLMLEKNALLIPTPGQTEQEYLAQRMKETGSFYTASQKELETVDLSAIMNNMKNTSGKKIIAAPFRVPEW